jgi:hypothetical protein
MTSEVNFSNSNNLRFNQTKDLPSLISEIRIAAKEVVQAAGCFVRHTTTPLSKSGLDFVGQSAHASPDESASPVGLLTKHINTNIENFYSKTTSFVREQITKNLKNEEIIDPITQQPSAEVKNSDHVDENEQLRNEIIREVNELEQAGTLTSALQTLRKQVKSSLTQLYVGTCVAKEAKEKLLNELQHFIGGDLPSERIIHLTAQNRFLSLMLDLVEHRSGNNEEMKKLLNNVQNLKQNAQIRLEMRERLIQAGVKMDEGFAQIGISRNNNNLTNDDIAYAEVLFSAQENKLGNQEADNFCNAFGNLVTFFDTHQTNTNSMLRLLSQLVTNWAAEDASYTQKYLEQATSLLGKIEK